MIRRHGGARALILVMLALAVDAPVAAGPSVRELVETADVEALAVSPDDRLVAFRVQQPSVERNTYGLAWFVADVASGRVLRLADGGDPIYHDGIVETESPVWSSDSRFLFHRALVAGAIGIWRTAADGSGSRLVAGGDADAERIEAGKDGQSLVYVTGPTRDAIARAERREYDEGILVDQTVDLNQNLFRGGFVHGRLSSQRLVGRWYQRDGLLWRAPRIRHRLDLRTLSEIASGPEPAPAIEPLTAAASSDEFTAMSPSGATAAVRSLGRATSLEVWDGRGRTVRCDASQCRSDRIVAVAWLPNGGDLLFTTQDRHFRQSLHLFNPASGSVRTLLRGEGLLAGGRQPGAPCAVTSIYALCVAAGPVAPPRLVRIALANGRVDSLFDPNSAVRARPVPRVEHLAWRLDDGRLATGVLMRPPQGSSRAPFFLTYYFCPGYLRGGTGDEFPLGPLVDEGFVVACLNVVPFDSWGDGLDRYRAAEASITSLVRMLERRGLIDPKRIGMAGFSAGSEATLWMAVHSHLLAAAGVSSPQYEPSAYWAGAMRGKDNPRVMREFMQAGPPDEDPERWKVISPALNTGKITTPLLMQLPEQEARYAVELHARLSNTTTPVELHAFPDEGHLKVQPRHRFFVYQRYFDWFRYWLKDHVDPDPERAAQYERWDRMRSRRPN